MATRPPKQKTVGLRPETHRKLKRVCRMGRFGTLQNTIDTLVDRELANRTNPQDTTSREAAGLDAGRGTSPEPLPTPAQALAGV